ncbi:ALQxL family class IV lanthipeptide [Pseudonocardia sp. GCM10023141]
MEIDVNALQLLPTAEPVGLIQCWLTIGTLGCQVGTCTHITHTHATEL